MNRKQSVSFVGWAGILCLALAVVGCIIEPTSRKSRVSLFVGVDASGSFHQSGHYENALSFLAHYLYGHLNELGGLDKPRELFVGSIGGKAIGEPKAFHPIHDLEGKNIEEIESALREWFPPTDSITDFNSFFEQVGRIAKERRLTLAPITVVMVTDGVPDVSSRSLKADSKGLYERIDLGPMEYLSRSLTLRVTYPRPQVSALWRKHVTRRRVRLWTVDDAVMNGWQNQLREGVEPDQQERLWKWVQDNVDYRVRSRKI